MINVSSEFLELMRERTDFIPSAEITLADGTELQVSVDDFVNGENCLTDAANATGIPIGQAICRTITLTLDNSADQYENVDFFGAEINMHLAFELSETTETINYGFFTVTRPEEYGASVCITAEDDMYKADRPFSTTLTTPVTAGALLRDICTLCAIPLASATFRNDDFVIQSLPERETTFRQMIGYIACIAVGNARINRFGRLEIVEYDLSFVGSCEADLITENEEEIIAADGCNIIVLDFEDCGNIIVMRDWINVPNYYASEVQITGVSVTSTGSEEDSALEGTDTYVLKVENPLAAGQEEDLAQMIAAVITAAPFLPFQGDHIALPIAEFMDPVAMLDRRGNIHYSFLTDINYSFLGVTTLSNSATSAYRSNAKYKSAANESYQKAREMIADQRKTFEVEYENLDRRIRNAGGYFVTEEVQLDGSIITYSHNAPTLAASTIIWKKTAETRSVSTDGGLTWNAGVTADGDVILHILTVRGINADWINAGHVSADHIDAKGLRVLDGNQNQTLYITSNGEVYLNVTSLQISGKNIAEAISEVIEQETNLLEDPRGLSGDYWVWNGTIAREQSDPEGGTGAVKVTGDGTDCYFSAKPATNKPLKSTGQTYRFSVWLKASRTMDDFIISINHENGLLEHIQLTTSWKRYTIECKVDTITNYNHVTIGGWASFKTGSIYIYDPVVEYSDPYLTQEILFNRLTDNGTVQGIWMQNNQLYMNATYIVAGLLAGERVNAKGLHVEDDNDDVTLDIDSHGNVTIRATSLSIGAKSIQEIVQDYSDGLDKLHGNLLEDPLGLSDDYWVYAGTLTRNQSDPDGGTNAVKLVANGSDCFFSTKASSNTPIKSKGQTYRFSVWLKASSTINNFRLTFNHSDGVYEQVTVTSTWKRYTFECEVKNTITSLNQVVMGGFGTFTSGTVYIYNPVVEYTSPYIDQQVMMDRLTNGGANQGIYLQNGELYINGNYIQSLLITASMIQSQDFYTVQATIGGFKIDSSSIYAEIQNGSTNLRTLELKNESQSSPIVGNKGKITIRDSQTSNTITLVDQRIYGNNTNKLYLRADADLSSETIQQNYYNRLGKTAFMGDLSTTGNLSVSGTKSAVRKTDHYGRQAYYCYEMPAPMFGDIGDGVIDEDGTCYVALDDIFTESTATGIQYQVFLQKCGPGDCWVEERNPEYFVVRGTPGLRFSWEVKGKQTGYEALRFNDQHTEGRRTDFTIPDYEQEGAELVSGMIQEEIMNYE